jgi:hypothetical protein
MRHLTVVARIVAAGAAVFAILGACGKPPTAPSARVADELLGTWTGSIGSDPASLTVGVSTGLPDASLTLGAATYLTDRSQQAPVQGRENVLLFFRASTASLHLLGSVSADGRRFTGNASGPWPASRPFTFTKR